MELKSLITLSAVIWGDFGEDPEPEGDWELSWELKDDEIGSPISSM
jgi:hypothetical protein